jgi:hypothetical protein
MQNGHACQSNGCYGGWYCNSDTSRCQAPPDPATCSSSGSDGGANTFDSGIGWPDATGMGGPVGNAGGMVDALDFAIVGDTRPAGIDDTSGYPVQVITQIWQAIQNENPRPAFAVTTGDYMFARSSGNEAIPQLQMYLTARASFSNIVFPTMGNHECTGATASNCGEGGAQSNNYDAYLQHVLMPIGQSNPYYAIQIHSTTGAWTAKFVFVAANAWGSMQESWLQQTMALPTTYTFIIRHERTSVTEAPGVSPSNQIIAMYPYTMLIVGHTHTYQLASAREVVVGNGGAPLTGGVNYGYVLAQQRADGSIQFTSKDYKTGATVQTFAVKSDGTQTQ